MSYRCAAITVAIAVALLVQSWPVVASQQASVYLPSPMIVLVDGVQHYGSSLSVDVGSTVCVTATTYSSSAESRQRFWFWIRNGVVVTREPCVFINATGTYVAVFGVEHRVVVESEPSLFYYEFWVASSDVFRFTAPRVVERGGVYEFTHWSGDAGGVSETVEVLVTRPLRLLAVYAPLYPLYVSGELVGYFPMNYVYYLSFNSSSDGSTVEVVEDLVVVGGSYVKVRTNEFVVTILGATHVFPNYRRYHRVEIRTPFDARVAWVEEGSQFTVSLPQRVDAGDYAYVFRRIVGDVHTDVLPTTVVVDRPLTLTAVYSKMYRVTIISPTGEKVKYVEEGGDLYVYEPPQLAGILLVRSLKHFVVNGEFVRPAYPGVLTVKDVSMPITVVALYEQEVAWSHVMAVAVVLAVIVGVYFVSPLISRRKKEDGGGAGENYVEEKGVGEQSRH